MSRIIYFILIAFFIALILGPIFIPILKRLKFGQNIRGEGPKSHQKKSGTPTMGGVIFILATAITLLVFERSYNSEAMVTLIAFIAFGFVGFLDDYLKIRHKDRKSTRLNSSHANISYAVFCLKKKNSHKFCSLMIPHI